jgi:2-polyprenyl-6-methoxyphenol hydroxylase-like FAD-dependent oxidoreductase
MNGSNETTGRYFFGHEKLYGYQGLRVYRQLLPDELAILLRERNVPNHYEKKFLRVLLEGDDYVFFEFADGSTEKADLLVGGNGIHSSIRQYVCLATIK